MTTASLIKNANANAIAESEFEEDMNACYWLAIGMPALHGPSGSLAGAKR